MKTSTTRLLCLAGVLSLSACGPVANTSEGEGDGSVSEGEGDTGGLTDPEREQPALFEGLSVALVVRGPGDRDLVAVVSGTASVSAHVVEVTLGSVPVAATVDGDVATFVDLFQSDAPPAAARVRLFDDAGHHNVATEVTIAPRVVRVVGESCDVLELADRCSDGLGCKGAPALCAPGEAPQITQVSYQPSADGPRLLIRGVDVDDDVVDVSVGFFNAAGDAVQVDLDGDDIEDASTALVDAGRAPDGTGAFFVAIDMGLGFDDVVRALDVVVRDRAGLATATQRVSLAPAPVRTVGNVCDPDGFDVCVDGALCSAVGDRSLCRLQNARLGEVCSGLSSVPFTGEAITIAGTITAGASVFQTPSGCASGAVRERPEAVIAIEVTSALPRLTLSTAVDGTACDTVVAVYNSCGAPAPLACVDDDSDRLLTSTVVLSDVAPGTYVVVVESWDEDGGAFGLGVSAE
jgi:hypothetical protein